MMKVTKNMVVQGLTTEVYWRCWQWKSRRKILHTDEQKWWQSQYGNGNSCRSIPPSENERRVAQILQDTELLICALTNASTTFICPTTLPQTGRPSAWTSANGSISDSGDVTTGWRNMLAVVRRGHGRAVQKPEDDEDVEENEMWGIEPSQNLRIHRRKWRGRDRGRERGWGRRNELDYVIA